ncbi:hypothetical protein [Neobacillus mesonae]|uniref:hypothetical protein n=1 Tax=Neobacillus mesonae TaxID=1193713 RepID=UPI000836AD39|nr:hypothetical protein [Neobacillus mesonae]
MKNIYLKVMNLANVAYLSIIELKLVFLQTILLIIISIPYTVEDIKAYFLLVYMATSIIQVVIFSIRRTFSKYNIKYLILLTLYFIQYSLVIIVALFLTELINLVIIHNILVIIFVISFFFIGFLNLSMSIKFCFFWRLKRIFPTHGEKEHTTEVKLKNLSPFLSVEKQIAYLLIHYGINLTIYGYYVFICLLAFKLTDFSKWIFLNELHSMIKQFTFINLSNAIGLFSIFLALLTICIPAHQRIITEAERKYFLKMSCETHS